MNGLRKYALLGPAALCLFAAQTGVAHAQKAADSAAPAPKSPAADTRPVLDILEFDVDGNTLLDEATIDNAVEPFLGPGKSFDDVDQARAALEKVYQDRGYKTVLVQIPKQTARDGVVILQVSEATVGHLNVIGSRYHSIDQIKSEAPAVAEGTVPDFNQVQKNLVALNNQPDRKVTPALKAGATPGTVDIDLVVDDHLPLHGSAELNNAHSQNTTVLRTVGTISYDNLWQLGHSASLSFQTAPEDQKNVRVFFGSYLMRFGDSPFSLLFNGIHNDSNVAAIGTTDVVGNGTTYGVRGVLQLPGSQDFYPSLTAGVDRKHINAVVTLSGTGTSSGGTIFTPIEYYPFSIAYSALLNGKGITSQFDFSVNFAEPRLGSDTSTVQLNRSFARGQMLYLRENYVVTMELPGQLQGSVRFTGQLTDQPLVSAEQLSVGGSNSVRGYLESEALGDYGFSGSAELRSPSFATLLSRHVDELRLFAFVDGADIKLRNDTPDQQGHFSLLSMGVGMNLHMYSYVYGSIDWAEPFFTQSATHAWDSRVLFRVWTTF